MELLKDKDEATKEKSEQDLHPGCVKRSLNFRDRLLIMISLRAAAAQGADLRSLSRIEKIKDLIDDQGANDYFDAIDESDNQLLAKWIDDTKKKLSQPDNTELRDPGPRPKRTGEADRGAAATFWIPSKLDAHIQEILKASRFAPMHGEFAIELAQKFGIKVDE